ncbi:hypothetical protein [Nonomuraea sp. NPDC049480]|uniref:hypothetical protein n=1 Tax=Nonomuraea sp. NPDC049480 TaxID=3364353 RepID=UPI0037BC393D
MGTSGQEGWGWLENWAELSSVFRHPAKPDLYIALADRWFRTCPRRSQTNDSLRSVLRSRGSGTWPRRLDTPEVNTSLADYVWLPIRFDGNMAVTEWHDEWWIDDIN